MGADTGAFQDGTALDPYPILHHHPSPNGDIGANCAVLTNLSAWVLERKSEVGVGLHYKGSYLP